MAYVFEFDPKDASWQQQARLSSPNPQPGDFFGASAALQEDLLLIGAPQDSNLLEENGALYVYGSGGTKGGNVPHEKLTPQMRSKGTSTLDSMVNRFGICSR